jgi:hypothetical protein
MEEENNDINLNNEQNDEDKKEKEENQNNMNENKEENSQKKIIINEINDKQDKEEIEKINKEKEEPKDNNINININQSDIQKEKINDGEKVKNEKEALDSKKKLINSPFYIFAAKIIDINSVDVLIYFLKGTLIPKKIVRSYRDLEIFRDCLLHSWPCTYVPNFPFRNISLEENDKIIPEEKKIRILNYFLKQIGEIKYLLDCEITKVFAGQEIDYTKAMRALNKESIKDISEKYSKIFSEYKYDKKENDQREKNIKLNVKLFEETYRQYLIIGATISKEMFNLKREQNTIQFVNNMFIDLEKTMPNKKKRLTNINDIMSPICSVSTFF